MYRQPVEWEAAGAVHSSAAGRSLLDQLLSSKSIVFARVMSERLHPAGKDYVSLLATIAEVVLPGCEWGHHPALCVTSSLLKAA